MTQTIYESTLNDMHTKRPSFSCRSMLKLKVKAWFEIGRYKQLNKISNLLPYIHFRHESKLDIPYENLTSNDQILKEHEVKQIVSRLDGIVIKPTETFSFWQHVDAPSGRYENHASRIVKGTSPAISQVTNMIYWLILHSKLEIIERHRHTFDLYPDEERARPFGTGATCIYHLMDLKFTNKTTSVYQLHFKINKGKLIAELRSLTMPSNEFVVYEERSQISENHYGDLLRHNVIYRQCIENLTKKVQIEYITENHALIVYKKDLFMGDIR